MENKKVWVVIGAFDGLGPATVKFLSAREQIVIPVGGEGMAPRDLEELIHLYGPIDILINNAGAHCWCMDVLKSFLPYMKAGKAGQIITLPPVPPTVRTAISDLAVRSTFIGDEENIL